MLLNSVSAILRLFFSSPLVWFLFLEHIHNTHSLVGQKRMNTSGRRMTAGVQQRSYAARRSNDRLSGFARLRPSRHLVTAPSHRSCDLLLKATRGVTIVVVSSRERKRRQPGLATDDPAFVGWHQLVRGIQGS